MNNLSTLTISMATVARSLTGARLHGINCSHLLRSCGIDPALQGSPQTRIPARQFIELCRRTSGRLEDEQYGLLERKQRIGSYHAIATNAVHGKTLGEAMRRFTSVSNLFDNSLHLSCELNDHKVKIRVLRRTGMQVRDSFAIDTILMILHRFASWLINERIALQMVALDYQAPPLHEHEHLFYGSTVVNGADYSGIEFDGAYFDRPVVQTELSLADYFQDAPANLYLPFEESGQYTLYIRRYLDQLPREDAPQHSLKSCCNALGISSDSLRRRLKQEGSSWQGIRNSVRREQAIKLLASSDSSVEQIAFSIGYTEAAPFIRAFRTWTGITPLQFRKSLQG
ncbi:AraC family transcriptional regulator [Zhongshania aliphaticivorans]|jgi:AraC-like DNA-binding protein|nr:AraC family transcriptional regulator [Zhongshania aliphaticivorans]